MKKLLPLLLISSMFFPFSSSPPCSFPSPRLECRRSRRLQREAHKQGAIHCLAPPNMAPGTGRSH